MDLNQNSKSINCLSKEKYICLIRKINSALFKMHEEILFQSVRTVGIYMIVNFQVLIICAYTNWKKEVILSISLPFLLPFHYFLLYIQKLLLHYWEPLPKVALVLWGLIAVLDWILEAFPLLFVVFFKNPVPGIYIA